MTEFFQTSRSLTHAGVMTMLQTAVVKAEEIGQPQCIVIVDASGELLGELRMTGAKYLARKSAFAKAQTSASIRAPSQNVPEAVRVHVAAATQNAITSLPGGLPIIIDGETVGAIGVGSGTGDQDIECGMAALEAVGADRI